MNERYFLPILLGLTMAGAVIVVPMVTRIEAAPAPQPDRARFMLECVQDYQYTPETCAAIWSGDDPPQRPDGADIPGC